MHINATFLIQIINFLLTYTVLDKLLFKPALASIKEKKVKQKTLEASIQKEEEKLLELEKDKDDKIAAFQVRVQEQYPFISPLHYKKAPELAQIEKEIIDTKVLQKQITEFLVKKVPHGY